MEIENLTEFQQQFANKYNVKQCHIVDNIDIANLAMISAIKQCAGWQENDEVIVSPVGFPIITDPIFKNNLTPVFAEIDLTTLNFNVDLIGDKITRHTRAIFVTPGLEIPADIDRLLGLCYKFNLLLIGHNCNNPGTEHTGELLTNRFGIWTSIIANTKQGIVCGDFAEVIQLCQQNTIN